MNFILALVLAAMSAQYKPVREIDAVPNQGQWEITLYYGKAGHHRTFFADLHNHPRPHREGIVEYQTWETSGDWLDHKEWFWALLGMDVNEAESFLQEHDDE